MCARVLRGLVLLTAIGLFAVPHDAHATQVLALDLDELGRESRLVVEGRVVDQRAFWNERRTHILTAVEVEVDRAHKGDAPRRLTVVQAGGELDGVRMTVHGVTRWRDGERVLLFLEPAFDRSYRVTGFSQGKFDLRTDPETGETVAVRPALGVETIGTAADTDRALRLPLRRVLDRAELNVREER